MMTGRQSMSGGDDGQAEHAGGVMTGRRGMSGGDDGQAEHVWW